MYMFFISIFFSFVSIEAAFFMLVSNPAGFILNSFMKGVNQDGRPFMESKNVAPIWSCRPSYGDPSGHTTLAGTVYFGLYLYYMFPDSSKWAQTFKSVKYWIGIALLCVFMGFIMMSRLIMGVHTFDQVIAGFMVSIWYSHLSFFFIWPNI